MKAGRDIADLLALMTALRAPDGCPWDRAQTFATIVPYTIEEAYEVADAVARGDLADLRDELGDLLLQVVFHAEMAEEAGHFAFADVVEAITAKLVRRHPHVFGTKRDLGADEVKALWDDIKRGEREARKAARPNPVVPSVLDGVPAAFPALMRADKLTRKAAHCGFDWPEAAQVAAKVAEELDEVREAAASGVQSDVAEELGDLLFAAANLARHHGVDPEEALRCANRKFERRFRAVESALAQQGRTPDQSSLAAMERLWQEVKQAEAKAKAAAADAPPGQSA